MAGAIEECDARMLFRESGKSINDMHKSVRITSQAVVSSPSKSSDSSSDHLIVVDSVESGCEDSNSVRMDGEAKTVNDVAFTEELEKELQVLKEENVQLRNQINNLISEKESSQNTPVVQIIFRDANLARKYRNEVEKYLKRLLSKEKNVVIHIDDKQGDSRLQFFQDFCVDNVCSSPGENETSKQQDWNIPVYDQHYTEDAEKDQMKETEEHPDNAKLVTCFNCLGNHTVDKCPEEVDRRRVSLNRQKFVAANRSNRYHEESEQLSKFTPGEISNELRKALGLKVYQLPRHIYTMRILGYPPGWLKYAEIESSGLTMYDTEGNAVEEVGEDGEIEVNSKRVQYDPNKLKDFPGFNVKLPHGFIDEYKLLNMPSMQVCHLRTEAEKCMKAPEASPYRKRKLDSKSDAKRKIEKLEHEEQNMDIDHTDAQSAANGGKDSGTSKFIQDSASKNHCRKEPNEKSSRPNSPSLTDLERAKLQLMQELEKTPDEDPNSDEQNNSVIEDSKLFHQSSSEADMISEDSQSSDGVRKIHHIKYSTSLSVHPGTPVVNQYSNFDALPDSSKFSLGVSEHIPFENLPNSIGKYEKMKDVLGKVRKKLLDLQQ